MRMRWRREKGRERGEEWGGERYAKKPFQRQVLIDTMPRYLPKEHDINMRYIAAD